MTAHLLRPGSPQPRTHAPGTPAPRTHRRIALYSHDTQGLGHIRRNSMIAAAIVRAHPDTSVLLVCGVREAASLPLPPRVEIAVLPGVAKDADGSYRARTGEQGLAEVIGLRQRALAAVLGAWAPDLLIVDKVARGLRGELDAVLPRLRARHGTRIVLGLRDVLDDPVTTRREWEADRTAEAIATHYDQVWVYGDPAVFDPAVAYGWRKKLRRKVRYTGYLADGRTHLLGDAARSPQAPAGRYVLGLVGGGQDGAQLARTFTGATLPTGHRGILVTGPYLPTAVADEIDRIAAGRSDLVVTRFATDVPALIAGASAAVSMGGYNSVCELLSARRPGLVVPRERPRLEQAVRADRLAELGLLDVVRAADLDAEGLSRWLASAVTRPVGGTVAGPIDLAGLQAIGELVDHQLLTRRDTALAG